MTAKYYESPTLKMAQSRRAALARLGWRPFQIFKTNKGTYAFWVA